MIRSNENDIFDFAKALKPDKRFVSQKDTTFA